MKYAEGEEKTLLFTINEKVSTSSLGYQHDHTFHMHCIYIYNIFQVILGCIYFKKALIVELFSDTILFSVLQTVIFGWGGRVVIDKKNY